MGERARLTFRREVRRGEARRVEARLRCVEEATFTVGTDTRTARETIVETTLPAVEPPPGSALTAVEAAWDVEIPREGPPSLDARRNKVVWRMEVTLRIDGAPDDDSTFTLPVGPEAVA